MFHLGAQPLDVHVHEPGVRLVLVAPDLVEQLLTGEHLAGIGRQGNQQVEFERRQGESFVAAAHLVRVGGNGEIADAHDFRSGGGRSGPQPSADSGDEFLGVERLDNVVVSAGFQSTHHIGGIAFGGEHDDGHARFGTQVGADVNAVHAGKHEVEQHQVWLARAERCEGGRTIRAERWLVALGAQHNADHLGERKVIIDHEDPPHVHLPQCVLAV